MAEATHTVSEATEDPALFSLPPNEVSDELRPRIDELELWEAVEHMREHGYAIIRDAAPPELMDDLRAAIHKFATPVDGRGNGIVGGAHMLLGRAPAVDRVATLPKVMAFAEFSVGKAMRAGRIVGSIKEKFEGEGEAGLALHSDQNWMPTPFPEHNLVVTFCFACEGMTGPRRRHLRGTRLAPAAAAAHPRGGKDRRDHPHRNAQGRCGRVGWRLLAWLLIRAPSPATRTVLHATYQRLYTQPIDDFRYLLQDAAYMAKAPEGMRQLLGADLFFHTATPAARHGHGEVRLRHGRIQALSGGLASARLAGR